MNDQHIKFDFPALTDEAAASLFNFMQALMYAIDEQFYKQIHRHYAHKLNNMMVDAQMSLDDPPF